MRGVATEFASSVKFAGPGRAWALPAAKPAFFM